jgi:hypothetical protein
MQTESSNGLIRPSPGRSDVERSQAARLVGIEGVQDIEDAGQSAVLISSDFVEPARRRISGAPQREEAASLSLESESIA